MSSNGSEDYTEQAPSDYMLKVVGIYALLRNAFCCDISANRFDFLRIICMFKLFLLRLIFLSPDRSSLVSISLIF